MVMSKIYEIFSGRLIFSHKAAVIYCIHFIQYDPVDYTVIYCKNNRMVL
jgi:hypothetical protein